MSVTGRAGFSPWVASDRRVGADERRRSLHAYRYAAARRARPHLGPRSRLDQPAAPPLLETARVVDTALRTVHLLAAIVWAGGTIALVFVAVPPVQRLEGDVRGRLLREFGQRWRPIGWSAQK